MIYNMQGGGGGLKINGTEVSFMVGENISGGDFVKKILPEPNFAWRSGWYQNYSNNAVNGKIAENYFVTYAYTGGSSSFIELWGLNNGVWSYITRSQLSAYSANGTVYAFGNGYALVYQGSQYNSTLTTARVYLYRLESETLVKVGEANWGEEISGGISSRNRGYRLGGVELDFDGQITLLFYKCFVSSEENYGLDGIAFKRITYTSSSFNISDFVTATLGTTITKGMLKYDTDKYILAYSTNTSSGDPYLNNLATVSFDGSNITLLNSISMPDSAHRAMTKIAKVNGEYFAFVQQGINKIKMIGDALSIDDFIGYSSIDDSFTTFVYYLGSLGDNLVFNSGAYSPNATFWFVHMNNDFTFTNLGYSVNTIYHVPPFGIYESDDLISFSFSYSGSEMIASTTNLQISKADANNILGVAKASGSTGDTITVVIP